MFCEACGNELEQDVKFCGNCGGKKEKAPKKISDWFGVHLCIIGYFLFGVLGGDPFIGEVNAFDYLSIAIGAGGIACSIKMTSEDRKVLRAVSIVINGFLIFGAISWIVGNGF